ncbi:MAG: NarK family nitrate/nitrite MFS transporter [Gammaproteobacteria bacterium]|jgi:NNP family nitrate/nitrite transporter-like MFS transporter|nr:NarK family nitrate/nitrite MFS transporter [Gammaproteobacteria bacterium]
MTDTRLKLFSFHGKMKILHLSWMAFFLTFVVWFNHAPLLGMISTTLGLTKAQVSTLLVLNVALAIPARIVVGMLTDRYGPRVTYSVILALVCVPCWIFAFADNFTTMAWARLALGFVGAGFVVGIRMVSEWFPSHELGTAEGIYGGWGNFGSAAAAMSLPVLALWIGGDDGWRWAVALTGLISLIFAVIWWFNVTDTPQGSTYFKARHMGGLEVTSRGDFWLLVVMKLPLYAALAALAWKLSPEGVQLIGMATCVAIYGVLLCVLVYDIWGSYRVNKNVFQGTVAAHDHYDFKQVAVLNILYFATFGSELAVVSMLPLFFAEVFQLDMVLAGLLASAYAFMNLVSRPGGGWLSDRFGRKQTLLILTAGLALGYAAMGMINAQWPLYLAVVTAMVCSFFVQAGEGAVFSVVPLIKRRLTGQIAGMTGAYGNVGAVFYLTMLATLDYAQFFYLMSCTAVLGLVVLSLLREPKGHVAEVAPDGSVVMIKVG